MSSIKKEANANQPPVSLKANNRAVRQLGDRHLNTSSRRRHCERSEAIHSSFARRDGLLRGACHRARIRATRWLAMTAKHTFATSPRHAPEALAQPILRATETVIASEAKQSI